MPVLDFKGKSVVEFHHRTVPHHRLEFDAGASLLPEGGEPDLNGNLIVEGDNLRALKALLPTHRGRVKCVYIDPPYNTGNEAWVYNDNLTQPQFKEWIGREVGKEGEDALRHDKWCCMMLPRLKLLRELMHEDGAIFVSIGDDELHHLRFLMGEVFGEETFVATIVWRSSTGPKQSNTLSVSHEYIVCHSKVAGGWKRNLLPRSPETLKDYTNRDDDPRGPWRDSSLDARNYYSAGQYSITCPGGRVVDGPPEGRYWSVSEDGLWELDEDGRVWWGEEGNNAPRLKRFLSEVKEGVIPLTTWHYREVGHTQGASQETQRILQNGKIKVTPKPVGLIERIVTIATDPGDLILDSFAGTGTTGEAVLKMNAEAREENPGAEPRRFVLVQQPYDTKANEADDYNICRNMTAARVRNAALGYVYDRKRKGVATSVEVPGLGGSFTYAKLGEPLFADYRSWAGDAPPDFATLAAYVFATETGRAADPAGFDEETGFIGATDEGDGTSYYLLYTPNRTVDRTLTIPALDALLKTDANPRWVVYAERLWYYPEQLRKWREENRRGVRAMLVPFGLK